MGLLEALTGGASGARPRAAVTRHLNQLLRTTRSFGGLRPDYGVAVDAMLGGAMVDSVERLPVERLRLAILMAVQQFEPGVVEPELVVKFQDNHGNLHFELRGELKDGSGAGIWHVRFSTWSRDVGVTEVV
jgi:predicted component of type VI protein secretion system